MKIPKESLRTARQLIRATVRGGVVSGDFARAVVQKLSVEKPRNFLATLSAYQRLLRLEVAQRHAVVESAQELSGDDQQKVLGELKNKYGQDITAEFKVNADLIGGMRVKLGSNVWDGSVKSRIDALREKVLA
jgi:F-type H+-transporting ATPase subunit delta